MSRGIVMRPMNDRKATPAIVDEVAADFDAIADLNRTTRRNRNVVDDFKRSRGALYVEGLVHGVRARAEEISRR